LKTRLGPHTGDNRIFELADAAERAGARGLIVHARYTSQMHGGPVHLDVLAGLVTRTRLKVVGNGSIRDEADVAAMEQTGVDAIMVGRAALREPAVFARLKRAEAPFGALEAAERHLRYLVEFRRELSERFPGDAVLDEDAFISLKARTHLFRYFAGVPGAAALRKRFNAVRTLAETRELVAEASSATGG
jgi:tRNA-dihydrouridine synthase